MPDEKGISLNRRNVVAGIGGVALAGLSACSQDAPSHVPEPTSSVPEETVVSWKNWSGGQSAKPETFGLPADVDELQNMVLNGPRPIRAVGAGHSFSGLVPSEGMIINLDKLPTDIESGENSAWIGAGHRLIDLSSELERHGLAFRNLGDINVQSLAGAVSTATHGTGKDLKCLAAELTGFEFVTGNGKITRITADENPGWLEAARVSLGTLGVMVRAQMKLVPTYNLHRKSYPLLIEDILARAPDLWARHRNFEFFYIPFSGFGTVITHDETDAPAQEREMTDDDAGLAALRGIRDGMKDQSTARRALLAGIMAKSETEDIVGNSWELLASQRNTPFNEMEYHLPPDVALDVFRDVVSYIETERPDVFFPIEVRQTAGDTAWLSPFQGGPRISIAVHAAHDEDYEFFFTHIEPVFRAAGGRPHWGKMHSLKAADLEALYPDLPKFREVRRQMDPDGVFMTPYLSELLGV